MKPWMQKLATVTLAVATFSMSPGFATAEAPAPSGGPLGDVPDTEQVRPPDWYRAPSSKPVDQRLDAKVVPPPKLTPVPARVDPLTMHPTLTPEQVKADQLAWAKKLQEAGATPQKLDELRRKAAEGRDVGGELDAFGLASACLYPSTLNLPDANPSTPALDYPSEGTLYSPGQDTWVKDLPATASWGTRTVFHPTAPVAAGAPNPQPRIRWNPHTKQEEMFVQAHLWQPPEDALLLGLSVNVIIGTLGDAPYLYTVDVSTYPSFFHCYADHPGEENLGLFEAWVPVPTSLMREPGFGVRVEVRKLGGMAFVGADQRIVHASAFPPANFGSLIPQAAGLVLDDKFLVDRDGIPDDLESILKSQLAPAIRTRLSNLSGTSVPLRKKSTGEVKGSFDLDLVDVPFNVDDVELVPTKTGFTTVDPPDVEVKFLFGLFEWVVFKTPSYTSATGPNDDEMRLQVKVSTPNFHLRGGVSYSPISGDFDVRGSMTATLSMAFNVDGAALGLFPLVDLDIEAVDFNFDRAASNVDIDQFLYDLLVNENALFDLILGFADSRSGLLHYLLDNNNTNISGSLSALVNGAIQNGVVKVHQTLGNGVAFPDGSGMRIWGPQFLQNCGALGCNGYRSGEILMSGEGLEVGLNSSALDRKAKLAPRRFPKAYQPFSTTGIAQLMRNRASPGGMNFDLAFFLNPTLINQMLRALIEGGPSGGGLLDHSGLSFGPFTNVSISPDVTPIFLPAAPAGMAVPGAKPLMIFLPNVRVQLSAEEAIAVDLYVGVDATIDPVTGQLDPSFAVAFYAHPLHCKPADWLVCTLASNTALTDPLFDFLSNQVVTPLLNNTIGTLALPQVLGLRVGGLELAQTSAQLGIYVDVQPVPTIKVGAYNTSTQAVFHLDGTPVGFPGAGPYTFAWNVKNSSGATVATGTGPFINVPRASLFVVKVLGTCWYAGNGTLTVTRAGASATASKAHVWTASC